MNKELKQRPTYYESLTHFAINMPKHIHTFKKNAETRGRFKLDLKEEGMDHEKSQIDIVQQNQIAERVFKEFEDKREKNKDLEMLYVDTQFIQFVLNELQSTEREQINDFTKCTQNLQAEIENLKNRVDTITTEYGSKLKKLSKIVYH
jgi:cell fate (sporulation/competence/biofilm development) regulator YlbF (YheA/YmcA/DUF963 family)